MNKYKWIQSVIWGVVLLNLVVICFVFLLPRISFIADHFDKQREELRGTLGPSDMPNQYVHTYQMMKQVAEMVSEESLLLFPPDDWEFGSPRSAVIQILYPRKVYFSGDPGFDEVQSRSLEAKEVYVVFNENWGKELCDNKIVERIGDIGFGICRIGSNKGS